MLAIGGAAGESGGGSLPTYQAQTAITGGTGDSSPAWPTHQADDIAFFIVQSIGEQAAVLGVAAGFAELDHCETGTGTTLMASGSRLTVFWCRATSSAMSTPTVTDPGDHFCSQMMTFRGCVTTGNPWSVYVKDTKPVESTSLTYPSVTPGVANCLIVHIGSRGLPDTGAAWSSVEANAALANVTSRSDAGSSAGIGGGLTVFTGEKAVAGATGASTSTVTSTINAMMVIALKGP